MAERLQGIFTPNIVPLDNAGNIHETELRRYTDWLIERGVHGLYPNGSTGEFTRFTAEERRRIIEIMTDQTRGRVPILAGAAEANSRETIKACEYYHTLGEPEPWRLSPRSTTSSVLPACTLTSRKSRTTRPIDMTLYNIPMFASPIDVPTVQRLSEECERVVAIKDSSGDLPHMMRMIQAVRPNRPDFSFLTGWDAALMPLLLIGCDGGTNATSGVVPEITRQLYDLTLSGQLDRARQVQYKLLNLFDTMLYSTEFPEGFRAALQLRGFDTGQGRQPMSPDQRVDLAAIRDTLQCLLAEEGFTSEPLGGCPVRPGSSDSRSRDSESGDIGRIVQSVVAELKRRGLT